MFTWLRNLLKSKDDLRQERLTAYLDGVLPADEQAQMAQALANDPALRAEMEAQQQVRRILRQLPRQPVPRNFLLDPAQFAAKPRPSRAAQLYPPLRLATAAMTLLLVGVIALDWQTRPTTPMASPMSAPASIALLEQAAPPTADEPPADIFAFSMPQDDGTAENIVEIEVTREVVVMEMLDVDLTEHEEEVVGQGSMAPMAAMSEMVEEEMGTAEGGGDEMRHTEMAPLPLPLPTGTAELGPRPTPAPTLAPRMAEPTPLPAAPLEADTAVFPAPEPEVAPPPPPATFPWRPIQIGLGILAGLLLLATLWVRRGVGKW